MKYKLKQWYPTIPKNWKVGDIISRRFSHYGHDVIGISSRILNFEEVENNPDFWEKVADYEIISFKIPGNIHWRVNLQSNGMYDGWSKDHALNELNKGIWNIYSVKRLSDGEIFSVGDKIDCKGWFGNIIKFEIINNELKIFQQQQIASSKYKPLSIQELIKFKQPLFKTEDGVDIYEGDSWIRVRLSDFSILGIYGDAIGAIKTFSTKEKAEEYVLLNKPCLSIKEIAPIFGMYHLDNSRTSLERLSEKLKDLVKSKQ